MALQLTKNFKGIDCSYWKIVSIQHLFDRDQTVVRLALYQTSEVREAGIANFVDVKQFRFPGVSCSRAELYASIKEPVLVPTPTPEDPDGQTQTNEFAAAEDC